MAAADPKPGVARVLVLLAMRNGAPWVRRQIDSVLSQVGVEVSILARDDGSHDGTRELVAELARADARVSLHPDHVASGSAAANFFALIAAADVRAFDYVAFCDQDDEWLPCKLERAVARLRDTGGGYSAAVLAQWPDGRTRVLRQSLEWRHADYLFEGAGQGCTFVLGTALFARARAELQRLKALQPTLHYHDWAIHALARSWGVAWTFDPEPVLLYRQHGGNDTGARSSGAGVLRRLKLIRSGWYRAQVRAIVDLVLAANPSDPAAVRWKRLDEPGAHGSRLGRAVFVARHGRRRVADRVVQLVAVLLGYL